MPYLVWTRGDSQSLFPGPPKNTTRCVFHREKLGINKAFFAVCKGRDLQTELKALPDLKPPIRAGHFNLLICGGLPREDLIVRKVDRKLEEVGESKAFHC